MQSTGSDLEYLPREELLEHQIRHIHELMSGSWQKAPGFVRRLAENGVAVDDLKTPEDIQRFPVLRKSALTTFQRNEMPFGGLVSVSPGQLRRIFSSPGPIYDPDGRLPSYYRFERTLAASGFKEGDIVLNCLSYHLTPAGAMLEEGAWNLGCAVIPAGIGSSEIQVRVAADLEANAYIGLPSYLKVLLEKAEESGMKLKFEKAFVIAERLPECLRLEFQENHGITTRQGYGTAEAGAIAYECEMGSGMHYDPSVLLEILEPGSDRPVKPGEIGEVVVTVMNPVNTLLRFATGDLSAGVYDECPCGRSSPRLTGILGRVDQLTKVRGLFVHPGQLDEVMSEFNDVERYRAVVVRERTMDDMIIEVQSGTALSDTTTREIESRIKETIKLAATVRIVESGTIPEGAPVIEDRRKWD